MNFTVSTIAASLAAYLSPLFPGVTFYQNPNQQGTDAPCMFLQQRYSFVKRRTSGQWLRTIGLDLTYLEDYNLPNMQELYQAAVETLDGAMDAFPYSDGTSTAAVLTYDRDSRIDLDAMHYKFELRVVVEQPQTGTPMQTMDYNEEVTNG